MRGTERRGRLRRKSGLPMRYENEFMNFTDIEYEVIESSAIIGLNRPDKLNALTYLYLKEIRQAIDKAVSDRTIVGLVITGNGRGFCSGLDAEVLATLPLVRPPSSRLVIRMNAWAFSYLLEVPKPVLAALNGAAGGGLILALMCDLRFAASEAEITTVFLKRGLVAEHGSSWILPRLVGTGRALDLLWASDKISAEEARQLGLVERVIETADLVDEAVAYIEKLAATSAPAAMAATKRMVYGHLGKGYREALVEAEVIQNEFVVRDDAREGALALLERRAPNFRKLGD